MKLVFFEKMAVFFYIVLIFLLRNRFPIFIVKSLLFYIIDQRFQILFIRPVTFLSGRAHKRRHPRFSRPISEASCTSCGQ